MKIRNGFVTNSSSSSFILAFKDTDSIYYELFADYKGEKFGTVLIDILNNGVLLEDAIKFYEEDLYWVTRYDLEWGSYPNTDISREWIKDHEEEFEEMIRKKMSKELTELRKTLENKGYIAIVNYSDHKDSDLEYYIIPNLKCCVKRISHH